MGNEFQRPISGTIDAVSETIDLSSPNSSTTLVQLSGTWSGTLEIQGSNDDTNYDTIYVFSESSKLFEDSITSNGSYSVNTNGYQHLRITSTAWTSGTVTVNVFGSDASSVIKTDTQLRGSSDGTLIGNDGDKSRSSSYGTDPQGSFVSEPISGLVTSNTTETPLTAGSTFTGSFVNCEKYSNISASVITDQISAIDGVSVEFSIDGTVSGIVKVIKTTIIPTTDGLYFSVPCEGRFFRVVYQNGATDQTVFKLDTELKAEVIGPSTLPLIASLEDTNSVPINRSIITGRSTDGAYANQRASGISTSNSTSSTLAADAVYTGTYEDLLGYSNVTITLKSDVDSAVDGLLIEWSADGVNEIDSDSFTITGGSGKNFSFGVISRYMRITYTNGDTVQSSFNLQTILHITRTKPSSHRIDDSINGENDAELIKSVITGKNPDGVFINKSLTGTVTSQSTTTPLLANTGFMGPIIPCDDYISVDVTVLSDQISEIGGIKIKFYSDAAGTSLLRSFDLTYANVNKGSTFNEPIQGSYFNVEYHNGNTDQTTLSLSTRLNDTAKISAVSPISEIITSDILALITKSVFVGENPDTGVFENAGVKNGRVQVESVEIPQNLSDRFQEYALNGGSREMNVDGSTTSVVFEVSADAVSDLVVDDLTFQAFSSGIKIDKFLGQNNEVNNGILVEVKSEDTIFTFRSIRNTTEFNSIFSQGPGRAFELIFASGNDSMVAKFGPSAPFVIKKQGTFGTDDYIRVTIRDNLSTIGRLRFLAAGRIGE